MIGCCIGGVVVDSAGGDGSLLSLSISVFSESSVSRSMCIGSSNSSGSSKYSSRCC